MFASGVDERVRLLSGCCLTLLLLETLFRRQAPWNLDSDHGIALLAYSIPYVLSINHCTRTMSYTKQLLCHKLMEPNETERITGSSPCLRSDIIFVI